MCTGGHYDLPENMTSGINSTSGTTFEYVGCENDLNTNSAWTYSGGTDTITCWTPNYDYNHLGYNQPGFQNQEMPYNLKDADIFLAQLYVNVVGCPPEEVDKITTKIKDSYIEIFKEMEVSIKIVVMPVRDQQTKLEIFPLKKKCVACHKVDE